MRSGLVHGYVEGANGPADVGAGGREANGPRQVDRDPSTDTVALVQGDGYVQGDEGARQEGRRTTSTSAVKFELLHCVTRLAA